MVTMQKAAHPDRDTQETPAGVTSGGLEERDVRSLDSVPPQLSATQEFEYADVVEVVETLSAKAVNAYLERGYRLIQMSHTARGQIHPEAKQFYVQKRMAYILGRTANTPRFEYAAAA